MWVFDIGKVTLSTLPEHLSVQSRNLHSVSMDSCHAQPLMPEHVQTCTLLISRSVTGLICIHSNPKLHQTCLDPSALPSRPKLSQPTWPVPTHWFQQWNRVYSSLPKKMTNLYTWITLVLSYMWNQFLILAKTYSRKILLLLYWKWLLLRM